MPPAEAWPSTTSSPPQTSSPPETSPPQLVLWQWEHRTGFKNYDEKACERIEAAYQRGESHVRLKAGKMKSTPKELFFEDMIQFDPITKNHRPIRRLGPDSCLQRWKRRVNGLYRTLETGRPRRMTYEQYYSTQAESWKKLDHPIRAVLESEHEPGCCTRVAKSSWFSFVTILVVVLNAVWLGIDANLNNAPIIWEADPGFQVAEYCFCLYFVVELIIRFCAFERKRDCWRDSWFCFDATLVVLMVGETLVTLPVWLSGAHNGEAGFGDLSILLVARILRLIKLGRVVRLLRHAPEALSMVKGLLHASRSVFVTMLLLLVLLYLFGIIFKTQAEASEELRPKFSHVGVSMVYLLLHGTFLDAVSDEVPVLKEESVVLTILFLVFIFLSSFTILNMLIGILVEVVTSVSRREQERLAVLDLKTNLRDILEVHDKDDDQHVRKDEFELLMRNPEMYMILTNFGVDAEDLVGMKDILFEIREPGEGVSDDPEEPENTDVAEKSSCLAGVSLSRKISFDEFMDTVLRLRGGNGALVRDIVDLREYVRQRMDRLELQLPGESQPFTDGPSPRWAVATGTSGPCTMLRPSTEGMEFVASQFAEICAEVRDLRERLAGLEKRQQEVGPA
uniref:EF-hand domain-containing protein n=1 Tax=Pyrodinium bahamense TaxID=73915 RepID=A0A7S0B7R4_9DINO|mmetsp:Transcript_53823/g.149404  ORF Transcript_53823/g.149404 Transcript_53823/m.149404 type:complete len:622 (+) Transcript_53823:54-1919(+)